MRRLRFRRPSFRDGDAALAAAFQQDALTPRAAFDQLTAYFWTAHCRYRNPATAAVYYPGLPSSYGADADGLEGASRPAPLWAAYLRAPGADPARAEAMAAYLETLFARAFDPDDAWFIGMPDDYSPRICEGADLALALWLSRETVWPRLAPDAQRRIVAWMTSAAACKTADNNWRLFTVLIDRVLAALDPAHRCDARASYQRVKSFYLGEGCFRDGPDGIVDYYNAWGFHYSLFWIDRIDPAWDRAFIHEALLEFCDWYQLLFTPTGPPLFGRSLCYRMAAPAPLLAASAIAPQRRRPVDAVSALHQTWRHFVLHGGVAQGRPTQGVFGDDARWLDPYSGPASSFWALRGLVLYYALDGRHAWPDPKPDRDDGTAPALAVRRDVAAAGFCIETDPSAGVACVRFPGDAPAAVALAQAGMRDRIKEALTSRAYRPGNNLLRAGVRMFDSKNARYR